MARGMDAVSARTAAVASLAGAVYRESMVLSFERLFLLAGGLFLLVLPPLLWMRGARTAPAAGREDVHMEM